MTAGVARSCGVVKTWPVLSCEVTAINSGAMDMGSVTGKSQKIRFGTQR